MEKGCLSSCSYIKPQRASFENRKTARCLSSCSYIKPQQSNQTRIMTLVVYHLVPTSNHNRSAALQHHGQLFIILFLHQTTTVCSQMRFSTQLFIILFLHQTTTTFGRFCFLWMLFIILFLHQTTTYSCKSTGNQ